MKIVLRDKSTKPVKEINSGDCFIEEDIPDMVYMKLGEPEGDMCLGACIESGSVVRFDPSDHVIQIDVDCVIEAY